MMTKHESRVHIGKGSLNYDRNTSVFINCPFDNAYSPIFDAIVFSTICCGFLPRCAIESGSTSVPRMDRITQAICASKYSIHDLSRCRGEGDQNLARFNMPLELGVCMAQKFGQDGGSDHDWLLLIPKESQYARYISDIAGYDPKQYDITPESAVPAVMSWLATRPDAVITSTPREVIQALTQFNEKKSILTDTWINDVPWSNIVLLAMTIGQEYGLIPKTET